MKRMARRAGKGLASYRQVQMNTSSPGQRVVMLYDEIVRGLKQTLDGFESNDPGRFETINNGIQRVEQIILELQLALDKENGGQIAENLDDLYSFWLHHLSDANAKKERKPVDDVLTMAAQLRKSWSEAAQKARQMGIG